MSKAKGGTTRSISAQTSTTPRVPDALSRLVDRFQELSPLKALGIVMGLAVAMLGYVYWDFLFGDAVLLYTDIGSDSVNYSYPVWNQLAALWNTKHTLHGFSLQTLMGTPVAINPFDVFQWIVVAGDPSDMPYRIYVAEMAKALVITAVGFSTFSLMGMRNVTSMIGALSLAFCGWVAMGAGAWYMLSTAQVLIVLTLFAVEYSLHQRRLWYLVAPLLFAFVAQIAGYFVVYLTASAVVYGAVRALHVFDVATATRRAAFVIGCLVVGLGLSYSALRDVYTLITQSGRAEALTVAQSSRLQAKKDNPVLTPVDRVELVNVVQRAYSTNALGVGSTFKGMTNYLEAPLLYMGLPMLLFAPLFGLGMQRKHRMLWGLILLAVLVMLAFPWFRYAFWGFKLDYFREFTMLIGTIFLIVAMWGLEGLLTDRSRLFGLLVPVVAVIMMALPFAIAKPADGVDTTQRMLTTLYLAGVTVSVLAYAFTRRSAFLLGVLAFTVIDLTHNAHATINKRGLLSATDIRNGKLYGDASVKALDWIRRNDNDLHRAVKYFHSGPAIHGSINDAMVQGFNGLIGYASIHNKYYLRFMAEMGCLNLANTNDSKWVRDIIQRPFLASALGARYFITQGAPLGFVPAIFPEVHRVDGQYIQRSEIALPLFVAHDTYITPQAFRRLPSARKDLMMYKAVVLDPFEAAELGLTPNPDAADTTSTFMLTDFAQVAAERRALMSVRAAASVDALTAQVNLRKPALVVIAVPYDPTIKVTLDGHETTTVIATFGLIGLKVAAGKHEIRVGV